LILARPARFELATPWFVVRNAGATRWFNSYVSGSPSLPLPDKV